MTAPVTTAATTTATTPTRRRRHYARIAVPVAVALTTPAVRMLALAVSIEDDGTAWRTMQPVLAIAAAVGREYGRSHYDDTPTPHAHDDAELVADGWRPQVSQVLTPDLIAVVIGEYGSLAAWESDGELVACAWPPEEDAARLAETWARLEREARERHARLRAAQEVSTS